MTLDEAIKEFNECAKADRKEQNYWAAERDETSPFNNTECIQLAEDCETRAEYNEQLAEWLRELVVYRELRICGNCRHYVRGTTHFGECHVTSDIEPCVVCVNQNACDTFFDYKDFKNEV